MASVPKRATVDFLAIGGCARGPPRVDHGRGLERIPRSRRPDPEGIRTMVGRHTPTKRLARAEEIASSCFEGAGFVSGALIPVDGGMAARRIV
jgi:NAD(P)-dependent dehydrogenase (short-subunit alcohol dehydrogenase family)